jgi:hypothetical protein
MEVKFGTLLLRFSVVEDSAAGSHNGGFCMRTLNSMEVLKCIIARCRHISAEIETAAAFLLYKNPYDSELRDVQFVGNVPNGSFTITVVSGHSLVMTNCSFSGNATKEVHNNNIIMRNCRFGQHGVQVLGRLVPGYNKSVRMVQMTIPPRMPQLVRKAGLSASVFVAAAVVAAAVAGVLLVAELAAIRVVTLVVREPRALANRRQE